MSNGDHGLQTVSPRGIVISQETSAAVVLPGRWQEVREGNTRLFFFSKSTSEYLESFHKQPGETSSDSGAAIKAAILSNHKAGS